MDCLVLRGVDERKVKLIKSLFKKQERRGVPRLETNFVRVRRLAKQFRKYSNFLNKFDVEVALDGPSRPGFVMFKDRAAFVYSEKRFYLKGDRNFATAIFLLRFDEFAVWPAPEMSK